MDDEIDRLIAWLEVITACYKLGVNSYVVKPVEFDKFYKTVSDLGTYWLVLNKTPL